MPLLTGASKDELISVDEALHTILGTVSKVESEVAGLQSSINQVLARDVCAECDLPGFDNSAMDGYALRSCDTAGATFQTPVILKICGEQPAGKDRGLAANAGSAVKIMTGAPMPLGCDSVVILEEVDWCEDCIELRREVAPGDNIRYAGEDIKRGATVLKAGTRLDAAEIGVLAALGEAEVSVIRRPRVAVITTGSELVSVGETLGRGQIHDINCYTLAAKIAQAGCELVLLERVADEQNALAEVIREAAKVSDVIITSGGVSVGDYDLVKETLNSLGRILFWGVAIKPGKPLAYGHIGNCPVFGLPGNPVSSMVAFDVFVRPALMKMSGIDDPKHSVVTGKLEGSIRHKKGRREFVRAVTTRTGNGYHAVPTGDQGSARMSSMLGANSYIIVPEECGNIASGESVSILPWEFI